MRQNSFSDEFDLEDLNLEEASMDEIKEKMNYFIHGVQAMQRRTQRNCTHTPLSNAKLIQIGKAREDEIPYDVRTKYADQPTVYFCNRCKTIVDIRAYSNDEIDAFVMTGNSMIAQVQIMAMAKMEDDDKKDFFSAIRSFSVIRGLCDFYADLRDLLAKQKGNNGKNNRGRGHRKGSFGISSSMMR